MRKRSEIQHILQLIKNQFQRKKKHQNPLNPQKRRKKKIADKSLTHIRHKKNPK
jgi:hypothetical protein